MNTEMSYHNGIHLGHSMLHSTRGSSLSLYILLVNLIMTNYIDTVKPDSRKKLCRMLFSNSFYANFIIKAYFQVLLLTTL